ncbi:MAG TPA: hypothetical protein VJ817_14370, partial [Gemmatimonadales bacterium]|nr:hypothetical protein [Gemmatimonadales bacterium]
GQVMLSLESPSSRMHRLAGTVLGQQQLKGQVMLSLESPSSRMHRLAGTVLHRDRYRRLDEILAEIDSVTRETVAALAAEYFEPERWSVVRLGPDQGAREPGGRGASAIVVPSGSLAP